MLRETVGHLRDLPRYRQILTTLVRYGYHDVVAALHLEGIVRPIERVTMGVDAAPQDRPRRLRLVCEDLGPTFVKLGQVLSARPDILPEAYTIELAALRDDVRPFPFAQVEKILTEDYRAPLRSFSIARPSAGCLGLDLSGSSRSSPRRQNRGAEDPPPRHHQAGTG